MYTEKGDTTTTAGMETMAAGAMNPAGTVVGVLIALSFVVVVSTLVAVGVLWKDGCCKKRQEESDEGMYK